MSLLLKISIWGAVALGSAVGALLLYLAARRVAEALLLRRLDQRVKHVQSILTQHEQQRFQQLDRLLFQLGEVHDVGAVESALNSTLDSSAQELKPQIRKLYQSLGLTDRYLKQLADAPRWTDRAAAARALGQLGAVDAIPKLVAAMRDPHEDARSVKLAAAQALGQMQAAEAIPLLLAELRLVDEWASPRLAEVLVSFGPAALGPLLEALADETQTNSRVWAAQILGRIGDPSVVQPLISRLRDRTETVRMSACEALGRLKDQRAVNDLMQVALRDPVPPVRAEAARALGMVGDASVVPSLVTLLSDPDYWARLRAIEAIEQIKPADPWCLDLALRDASPEVRGRAAVALQRIGLLDKRIEELVSPDRAVVERAHNTLVEMGRAGLMESLLAFLEHADFRIRARMADVLGEVGSQAPVSSLSRLLRDAMWPVRARAAEALGKIRPPNGVGLLLPALSDGEETVRAAAAAVRGLGTPEDDANVEAVVRLFDTANAEVRHSVLEAVAHFTRPSVEQMLERAVVDLNAEVRLCAVKSIGTRSTERWVETLAGRLADPDTKVRAAAAQGLGRVGTPAALEGVVRCLSTPDRDFREALTTVLAAHGVETVAALAGQPQTLETRLALVWTLGKTADPKAVPRLAELAQREEPEVRAAVAGALGKLEGPESEAALGKLLEDRNERVRAAAVNGLGTVGSDACTVQLMVALEDPDPFVRHRVSLALGRVGTTQALSVLEYALQRASTPVERAYAVVGYALAGGELGFRMAISALSDTPLQEEITRLLQKEPPEVQQRFRENLHLQAPTEGQGEVLQPADLSDRYATVLRTSQSAEDRAMAVKALQSLGLEGRRELLMDALRTDPAAEVRRLAVQALAGHAHVTAVTDIFVDALRDPTLGVQIEAARGLLGARQPAYNRPLLRCLLGGNEALSRAAVDALIAANMGRAMAFVDELMGYREEDLLCGGATVLGALGEPRTRGVLQAWLTSKGPKLRAAAARGLGRLGTLDAKEALIGSIGDPAESVRLAVMDGLSTIPGDDVMEALGRLARDPSLAVRMGVARLAGRSQSALAAQLAEVLVEDPDEEIRVEALLSLLRLRDVDAATRFVALLDKQPDAVKTQLSRLPADHPALLLAQEMLATDRRPAVRVAALKALCHIPHRPMEMILEALADPEPAVRVAAIEVASYMDQPAIQTALERLLRDPEQRVRDAVRKLRFSVVGK